MRDGCGNEAQLWGCSTVEKVSSAERAFKWAPPSTPVRCIAEPSIVAIFRPGAIKKLPNAYKTSGLAPVFGLWSGPIRKKVIGHGMRRVAARFALGKHFRNAQRAFTLLQKQPREGCVGVVVHPLIDQRANFLAEIGGMREPRQFKALQRILRSREKKLPRGLGRTNGHGGPPLRNMTHISRTVKDVKNT